MQPQNMIILMNRVMNYKTRQTCCILHMEGPSSWWNTCDNLSLGVCIGQAKLLHINIPLIHPTQGFEVVCNPHVAIVVDMAP